MEYQHTSLAAGRWQTMTLAEQMGNIGSEVSRACAWEARGQMDQREKAFDRLLELFDLTVNDPRWRGARRRELTRARETIRGSFVGNQTEEHLSSWKKYFDAFAIYARAAR